MTKEEKLELIDMIRAHTERIESYFKQLQNFDTIDEDFINWDYDINHGICYLYSGIRQYERKLEREV